jgi:UDP-N-acetylglucosamine--N-acetylmuramyl-(pentapeptide) pyrophosphoryl-undecaprenol N-acetylglucosamine transferase
LVPYPHAWHYQHLNANYLVTQGAAEILPDEKLEQELFGQIQRLITNTTTLNRMRSAMSSLASPDADKKIAEIIYSMAYPVNGGKPA